MGAAKRLLRVRRGSFKRCPTHEPGKFMTFVLTMSVFSARLVAKVSNLQSKYIAYVLLKNPDLY
jgi:hypothetical protein